jgi:hypothetical protein
MGIVCKILLVRCLEPHFSGLALETAALGLFAKFWRSSRVVLSRVYSSMRPKIISGLLAHLGERLGCPLDGCANTRVGAAAAVGFGLLISKAVADINWPGWQ